MSGHAGNELRTSNTQRTCIFAGRCSATLGMARSTNEDRAAYIIPNANDPRFSHGSLAIVADGMGGHAAGEVASAIAVEVISKTYYETDGSADTALETGFHAANAVIYEAAGQRAELEGMGTTCTALVVRDGKAYWAHVGDSRLYLLRDLHTSAAERRPVAGHGPRPRGRDNRRAGPGVLRAEHHPARARHATSIEVEVQTGWPAAATRRLPAAVLGRPHRPGRRRDDQAHSPEAIRHSKRARN